MISVVIPTLNEESNIHQTVEAIQHQTGPFEVIVVDGGSTDHTLSVLERIPSVRVFGSKRGRAEQMNVGAANARGDVFLFLHADTILPHDAFDQVRRTVAEGAAAGTFRLRFSDPSLLLRLSSALTRVPLPSLCFGDRGLFATRAAFDSVAGFPAIPIFEDLSIVRSLQRIGPFAFLHDYVVTSSRRFDSNGHWRQQWTNARLWFHYLRGVDPVVLSKHYDYPNR